MLTLLVWVHYPIKDGAIFMISSMINKRKNIIPKSRRIIKSFLPMKPPPYYIYIEFDGKHLATKVFLSKLYQIKYN